MHNKGLSETNDYALIVLKSLSDSSDFEISSVKAFDRSDREKEVEIIELPFEITHSQSKQYALKLPKI